MGQYRKKPVVIEAEQYRGGEGTLSPKFQEALCWHTHPDERAYYVPHIHTLEGRHDVGLWDWIIRGVKGEFYPCKPDIFEQTYEQVSMTDEEVEHAAEAYGTSHP